MGTRPKCFCSVCMFIVFAFLAFLTHPNATKLVNRYNNRSQQDTNYCKLNQNLVSISSKYQFLKRQLIMYLMQTTLVCRSIFHSQIHFAVFVYTLNWKFTLVSVCILSHLLFRSARVGMGGRVGNNG